MFKIKSYLVETASETPANLKVYQDGLFTVFECTSPEITEEIIRLAAEVNGTLVPIGVMLPTNGSLYLKKKFSSAALLSLGISEVNTFCFATSHDGILSKYPPSNPSSDINSIISHEIQSNHESTAENTLPVPKSNLWSDTIPPQLFGYDCFKDLNFADCGALHRSDGDIEYLAVPITGEDPFPMMPVFYFGQTEVIENCTYEVFKLKNGILTDK